MRLDGGLFFASADAVEDRVRELAISTAPTTAVVLDLEGVNFIDSQGSATMREIVRLCEQAGVDLRVAHLKPHVRDLLRCDGVLGQLGETRIHQTIPQAVEAATTLRDDRQA